MIQAAGVIREVVKTAENVARQLQHRLQIAGKVTQAFNISGEVDGIDGPLFRTELITTGYSGLREHRKPTGHGLNASRTTSRTVHIPPGRKKIRDLVSATHTLATLPFARVCITNTVIWGQMLHLLPVSKGVFTK